MEKNSPLISFLSLHMMGIILKFQVAVEKRAIYETMVRFKGKFCTCNCYKAIALSLPMAIHKKADKQPY